jgi:NAD(P)-dependent dehydrogenase (short-subunit alcohol dehydrogenase family)
MTRYSLSDKVVLITGAGRGLGAATATALTQRGARVVIADIDRSKRMLSLRPSQRAMVWRCNAMSPTSHPSRNPCA